MPYKRRYSRNSRYSKNKSLAAKAYQLAKKAQVQKELKHNAITVADTTPDSTGSIEELSVVAQGDTNNTRDGDVIYPTSVAIRGKIAINSAASQTQVRVLVFKWRGGSPTAVTDILVSAIIQSFKSENNRYESSILYDRVFTLESGNRENVFFQKKIKLSGMLAYPQGSSIANKNSIWMLLLSNEAVNTPTSGIQTRLYFKDA